MRATGHKLDVKLLRDDLEDLESSLQPDVSDRSAAKRERSPDFFLASADEAIEYLRLGYLFDRTILDLQEVLRRKLADLQTVVELGDTLLPDSIPNYLAGALVAADDDLVKWLARLPAKSYTSDEVETSEVQYAFVRATQAGILQDSKKFAAALDDFRKLNTPKKLLDPREDKARFDPLLALLAAIAGKNQAAFEKAWQDQASAWKKLYSKKSESANFDGILDLEAITIAVIAKRAGLDVPATNPYAPAELVEAACKKSTK